MGNKIFKWDQISHLHIEKTNLIKDYKGIYYDNNATISESNLIKAKEFIYNIRLYFNDLKWNNIERNKRDYLYIENNTLNHIIKIDNNKSPKKDKKSIINSNATKSINDANNQENGSNNDGNSNEKIETFKWSYESTSDKGIKSRLEYWKTGDIVIGNEDLCFDFIALEINNKIIIIGISSKGALFCITNDFYFERLDGLDYIPNKEFKFTLVPNEIYKFIEMSFVNLLNSYKSI